MVDHDLLWCLRLLATLKLDRARMQLIAGFVDTYLRLSKTEQRELAAELEALAPKEKEAVMEIVTSWEEQGIKKGIQQGLQQGALTLVVHQLKRRFGTLSRSQKNRIAALSLEQLESLGEALLDFSSFEDLNAWLEESGE